MQKPEWARPYTAQEQSLFDQGHKVQQSAQKFFPKGISIQAPYWNFQELIHQTQLALQKAPPYIYEAFFAKNDLMVRVDILQVEKEYVNIIEVKSSVSIKEDHIWDTAIQKYVLNQCGFKVQHCYVLYINKDSVYPNLKNLFVKKDVTAKAEELQQDIHCSVQKFKQALSQKSIPKIDIGPHCKKPYPCRFISHCWKSIPSPSVFDIPQMGDKSWEYYKENKIELNLIPDKDLESRQLMYKQVHVTGRDCIKKEKIKEEISRWKFPFYYLDFETLAGPIPYLEGAKPFQAIPFQFHCLRQNTLDKKVQEDFYLHTNSQDPRKMLAERLVRFIKKEGSVLAYYKNFESKQLKSLAEYLPEFREVLLDIESRLEDPLPLLREAVCYKDFGSSWSLKSVAPVLLGDQWKYSKLEVQDGLSAQRNFEKMISLSDKNTQKEVLRKNLIQYCRQDTWCLALIVQWLFKNSNI